MPGVHTLHLAHVREPGRATPSLRHRPPVGVASDAVQMPVVQRLPILPAAIRSRLDEWVPVCPLEDPFPVVLGGSIRIVESNPERRVILCELGHEFVLRRGMDAHETRIRTSACFLGLMKCLDRVVSRIIVTRSLV